MIMSKNLTYKELEQRIKELEKSEYAHKQVEDALKESEEKFKSVFESSNVGKSITSPNGKVMVNQAFADMLGYTREELKDKTWQELTPLEDIEVINQKLIPLLSNKQTAIRFEKKYVHKNGSFIWADVSTVIHRTPNGKPLHFITTVVDITEQKQAEQTLILNEKRYQKAQDLGHVGNWEYNLETTLFWASDEAKRIYGFDLNATDFTTEEVEKCIPERGRVHQVLMDLIEKDKEYNIEFDIITRNTGERKTIHSIAELEKNTGGKPVKVSGVVNEITQLKEKTVELKNSEKKYRTLFENINEGFALHEIIVDADGIPINYRFLDINPAFTRLTGLTSEDVRGKTAKEVLTDITIDLEKLIQKYGNVALTGEELIFEYYSDGIMKWFHVRAFRFAKNQFAVSFNDITEAKKVQFSLNESEAKFRGIYEQSPISIEIYDIDGKLLDVNRNTLNMFGVDDKKYVLGFNLWEDPNLSIEKMKSLQNGKPIFISTDFDFEIVKSHKLYPTSRSGIIYLDMYAIPLMLNNEITGFLVQIIEVTDRKQAEEMLRTSDARYSAMIENIGDVIGIVGADGITKYQSPNIERLFGWKPEDLVGTNGWDKMHPDDVGRIQVEFSKILKNGKALTVEYRFKCKNGNYKWIELTAVNRIHEPAIDGLLLNYRDITERKHIFEELKRRNNYIESIMDNIPIGLAVNSIDDGDVKYMNSPFEKIYGWSREILTNTSIFFDKVFSDSEYRNKMRSQITTDMQSGDLNRMVWSDLEIITSSGEERYVTAINIPLIEQNLMISTVQNTTARKQIEIEHEKLQNQLQQSQKMESVGRLAGGVAHDYNNISSIIIGYAELALEKVELCDPLHDNLLEILKAANRSTDITRQLLAFARKQTVLPKVLDLKNAIGSMIKMLRRMIGENIDLAWLPGVDVWPIKIDPSQIDQILANLCINARDAIANVGKITIETNNIIFDEDYCCGHAGVDPGEYVLIAVSDDGSGMTLEIQNKIFEPFFTTKDIGEGTGLGLSTVYGIVKQNNGFINVYSESEKGTTIRIYLPRYAGRSEKAPSENTQAIPSSRGEKILLVEDDESILDLSKRILENLGYTVLSSTSPIEVTKLAAEHTNEINLLITDVIMPEMNGRELAEQLQSQNPNLKTLFMSGYTADIISNRGVLEEGVSFIAKPFSIKQLAFKVREVLDEVID
jgi:PAS domain S-box-containing protein